MVFYANFSEGANNILRKKYQLWLVKFIAKLKSKSCLDTFVENRYVLIPM